MRTTLLLCCALAGCEAADDAGPRASAATDAVALADGESPDAGPPLGGATWVVVSDVFEGLALGEFVGVEVDAVTFDCPDGRAGAAVAADGRRTDAASAFPVEPALGEPDGPCDPVTDCAAPLGVHGWLSFRLDLAAPAGCTITVHEQADREEERFEVYLCPSPAFDATCDGPVFRGGDGEAASAVIP